MSKTLSNNKRRFLIYVNRSPGETWRGFFSAKIISNTYHDGLIRVEHDPDLPSSYRDAAVWITTAGTAALIASGGLDG